MIGRDVLIVALVAYCFGTFNGNWYRSFYSDGEKKTAWIVSIILSLLFGGIILFGLYKDGYLL